MKAVEATATIDSEGQLSLDLPLNVAHHGRVRVIVLIPESEEEIDPDNDSAETVIEGIREGCQQALADEVRPVSELWDTVDAE